MHSIRLALPSDAKAILAIYTPYVTSTSITFETAVPEPDAFRDRIIHYMEYCPWLVCEINGQIAGYAYASRYRERVAYQWSVECSVYIHDQFMRNGVARALYATLFTILARQGFRNVYAVINLPNDSSVALHERMGFRYFAMYEQAGYKLGQWKNVGWWRLILNGFDDGPEAPVPFNEMNKDFLPLLFEENSRLMK